MPLLSGSPGHGKLIATTPLTVEYMYVIAISNEKGGTGKSTTAANVAAALAERGHRTLLVDLDPSFGLTRMLGVLPEHFELTLLDVLRQHDPKPIQAATQQLKDLKNLFLVPTALILTLYAIS